MMQPISRKITALLLTGLALTLGFPGPWAAIAAEDAPTDHPKIWLSPEIEVKPEPHPPVKSSTSAASKDEGRQKQGWFSRNKWWVLLGAVVAGTAAALVAGGGSDGGGEEGGTGTYNTDW